MSRLAFDFSAGLILLIHTPVGEEKLPSLVSPCERRLVLVCRTKGSGGEGKRGRLEISCEVGKQKRMCVPGWEKSHGSGRSDDAPRLQPEPHRTLGVLRDSSKNLDQEGFGARLEMSLNQGTFPPRGADEVAGAP